MLVPFGSELEDHLVKFRSEADEFGDELMSNAISRVLDRDDVDSLLLVRQSVVREATVMLIDQRLEEIGYDRQDDE